MSGVLDTVRHGRVLRLSLNRPEKRNALNADLCRELTGALELAGTDPEVGAILLNGNGKSFCAGMDLNEVDPLRVEEINAAQEQLFTIGARISKPIVAAVHGAALGGGTGLVANCHIVIAAPDATLGLTEIRFGLWPFLVYRAVAAALGERRTLALALTGRVFDAREAREMGLVSEICEDAEGRSLKVAEEIAASSPTAIERGMGFVREVRGKDWEAAGQIARRIRNEVFGSPDFQEGIQAFREKRPPRWPSIG